MKFNERAYHLGFSGHALLIAGHGSADLEFFVEDSRVDLIAKQTLLSLGLFALARPDHDDR